jgi:hypothetical protein
MASLRKRGGVWYYRFVDADGIKRERKGCPDKSATQEVTRAAEQEVARIRAGLVDRAGLRVREQARRPIGAHLDDWQAYLRSRGTEKHARVRPTAPAASLSWRGSLRSPSSPSPASPTRWRGSRPATPGRRASGRRRSTTTSAP